MSLKNTTLKPVPQHEFLEMQLYILYHIARLVPTTPIISRKKKKNLILNNDFLKDFEIK